jgi:hypothetical protein
MVELNRFDHTHTSVNPKDAKKELEKRIKQSGKPMSSLTPTQGIRLMLDFYRDVRADGCELGEDGDMLLFQWGTYDFSGARSFQFDITRQFTIAEPEDEDDDSAMSQLSFTFHFTPSPQFDAVKDGNRWCMSPDELEDFEAFITGGDSHRAVATAQPAKVTLEYGGV